jgi:tRNA A-37 threonylcarbamoyl transferase component Bud32
MNRKNIFRDALWSTIRLIHAHNFYHGDPVIENLLYQDGKIVVLDFTMSAIMNEGNEDVDWMIRDDDALVDSVVAVYTIPPKDVPWG